MILILSDEKDATTNEVINWLDYYGVSFLRLNDTSPLKFIKHLISQDEIDFVLEYQGRTLKLSDIKACWYRRGQLGIYFSGLDKKGELQLKINAHLELEYKVLLHSIYKRLDSLPGIGSIFNNKSNKLENLLKASQIGLDIPSTTVVASKKELIEFYDKYKKIITKSLGEGFGFNINNEQYYAFSSLVREQDINKAPVTFAPTLFQEYLEKEYELRIFYLNKKCYSMAIFSQLDEQTKVDFRNYNSNKPNRTSPYILPAEIEKKIIAYMELMQLNSGSLDIVVTKDNRYVFLEVNPVGQFNQVSFPCNYYLEREIAKYLAQFN